MSEQAEPPKKKATANPASKLETERVSPATPRKRKAPGRAPDKEPSAPETGHAAEPTAKVIQGRRSDLSHVQSTGLERQRRGRQQTLPMQHWTSTDTHRPRKSNMSNPSSRPSRTRRASVPSGPPRTMLQHAWQTVLHSDPLMDSDEECPDEHLRLDYNRRMQVIARLRGRPPTPELAYAHTLPA